MPCLSAPSASAAVTAATAAVAVSAACDTDDVEVCAGDSQPLLSPLARLVPKSYICNWAQAIQCSLPTMKPELCQQEGCNILVHHLCQGELERREGYGDTVACFCCLHHPDYKYMGAPPKDNIAIAKCVLLKAKMFNIQSQVAASEGTGIFLFSGRNIFFVKSRKVQDSLGILRNFIFLA